MNTLVKTIPIIEFEKETAFPKTSKYSIGELLPLKDAMHDVSILLELENISPRISKSYFDDSNIGFDIFIFFYSAWKSPILSLNS